MVVGRFDHFIRCAASLNSNSTFDRCPSSSEPRKPFALATILEVTLKELWAGASPQHRMAAKKLLLLVPRTVIFTIRDAISLSRVQLCAAVDASFQSATFRGSMLHPPGTRYAGGTSYYFKSCRPRRPRCPERS